MPIRRTTKADTKQRMKTWKKENKAHVQQYQRKSYRQRRIGMLGRDLRIAKTAVETAKTDIARERASLKVKELEVKIEQLEHDQRTDV